MAIVTATITVDFTANYAGDHRVCFRIQGSGDPYDCSTIVNCVGGATACQAIINTPVNTTSCDGTVTFEGYVQAICEDVLSTNGRDAFTADFVPNIVCQRNEIVCARTGVASIAVTNGGQEYVFGLDTLTVIRDGGDAEVGDATASIATVGSGVINSVTGILAAGAGYTALDVLTVTDGGGAGAGATIRVDTIGGGGTITSFTLLTNGAGYVGPFTFIGGTGVGGTFDIQSGGVDYDVFGTILTVNVTTPGLYSIVPTITITSGTGSGAVLTPVLADCAAYINIGNDCAAAQVDLASGLVFGETFAACIDGGLVAATPADYDVTEVGCCIPADTVVDTCFDYHLDNLSGAPINVQYTACDGIDTTVAVPATTLIAVCAVAGGVVDLGDPDMVITNTGTPCT